MDRYYGQADYPIRCDWGPVGARATDAQVAVVVDVLSYSTSVCVAIERGMRIFPFAWKGEEAAAYAEELDAFLAVGRLEATKDNPVPAPSLSPAGLMVCTPIPRVFLPSPNGASICHLLRASGASVALGGLRNARAVAGWLAPQLDAGAIVAVIAAGERWESDDSLRPALEDQLGAGAVLAGLADRGYADRFSPEAAAAVAVFRALAPELAGTLRGCVGGRELISLGFGADVEIAAALDASATVPVLATDGGFEHGAP